MFNNSVLNFVYSVVLVGITYAFCRYFNDIGMVGFYDKIQLSSLTPPNYVFPIVWIILYTLLVISFDMILNHPDKQQIWIPVQMYIVNLFLQVVWSFLFFAKAYFMIAFAVIVVLFFASLYLTQRYYYLKKTAAYMLLPYNLWILFATYLNWVTVDLNGASYTF
ncbi:MAG: tryptophan-rich sensory protein [Alphaproteobacteria bacterium]|nr:tryptophan-rich sensory protein [Alphaproteobacteria bacterium]